MSVHSKYPKICLKTGYTTSRLASVSGTVSSRAVPVSSIPPFCSGGFRLALADNLRWSKRLAFCTLSRLTDTIAKLPSNRQTTCNRTIVNSSSASVFKQLSYFVRVFFLSSRVFWKRIWDTAFTFDAHEPGVILAYLQFRRIHKCMFVSSPFLCILVVDLSRMFDTADIRLVNYIPFLDFRHAKTAELSRTSEPVLSRTTHLAKQSIAATAASNSNIILSFCVHWIKVLGEATRKVTTRNCQWFMNDILSTRCCGGWWLRPDGDDECDRDSCFQSHKNYL